MGALKTLRFARPARPAQAEQVSMALPQIVGGLEVTKDYRVLDLGQAFGSNVEVYTSFAKKIYIEDLYSTISSNNSEKSISGELLPLTDQAQFDIILCWDLLNYLSREQAKELGAHLARVSVPGTVLYLMLSILPEMPDRPAGYRLLPGGKLNYRLIGDDRTECPRYSKGDLTALFPGFTRERSFLLRNGMEEQILVFGEP